MKAGETKAYSRPDAVTLQAVKIGIVNRVAAVGQVHAARLLPHASFIAQHIVPKVVFKVCRGAGNGGFVKRHFAPVHFGTQLNGRYVTALQAYNGAIVALV